jgi:hypothetical protein
MSVSQHVRSVEGRHLSKLALPLPSVGVFAVGAPVWVSIAVILASALAGVRPLQFLVLQTSLRVSGASTSDSRLWAYRAVYYGNSPDPTRELLACTTSCPHVPSPRRASSEASRSSRLRSSG